MTNSLVRPVAPVNFAIRVHRACNQLKLPHRLHLHRHSEEDYALMRCYLGHACGFAIHRDGELVNLFSYAQGQGDALVAQAIKFGAAWLSCFDGPLVALYRRHGFVPMGRQPFDASLADPEWREWLGAADVIWMAR